MRVAVVGAGFAGLAAADALAAGGVDVELYEAKPYWGGHTHSETLGGFTFDEGPHVSFTNDERVRALFAKGAGEVIEHDTLPTNYYRGHWLVHPAQCHLHGLDPDLVTRCIVDLANAQRELRPAPANYAEWCQNAFGDTFAEQFPFAYTRKYWTVEPAELGTDWIGSRVYAPKLSEVVRGAIAKQTSGDFHYLSRVRYPRAGGYQSFMRALLRQDLLRLGREVASIDMRGRRLRFAEGSDASYDRLVSTMPLPELVARTDPAQVPSEVRAAAEALRCTSIVLVDVAVRRSVLSAHHWFYVYDEDVSFSRASFPHMLSPENAPPGLGSIQVEVYHSPTRPLPCAPASLPERVVGELVRLGVLESVGDVIWARHREVPYGNVVFDHRRAAALETIRPWLEGNGVLSAGRYGEWAYFWTDDATRSGWAAAARILDER